VTTSVAGRLPLFFAVRCLATFVWLRERGASLSPSLRRLRSIFRGFRLRIRTAPAAPLNHRSMQRFSTAPSTSSEFLLANGALVDERALIKSARHAPVFQRMLMRPCDHCCADFKTAVVGALARSAARSERRVVGAARGGRELRRAQLSAPARWRQGRCPVQPPDVFGGRCCVRRAGRQRVARIHPDAADASSASLSTRSTHAAWHGPANRRAARLRDLLCAAELPLASATDDAHHRRGEACSSSSTFVLQSTDHRSQRCSLSSSPLASLLSRHNSKCRSTLRSWISTTLLVRTDKRTEHLCC
jgi:hypothetical protein